MYKRKKNKHKKPKRKTCGLTENELFHLINKIKLSTNYNGIVTTN